MQGGPSLNRTSIKGFGPAVLFNSTTPVAENARFVIGQTSAQTQSPCYPTGQVYLDPQSGLLFVEKAT